MAELRVTSRRSEPRPRARSLPWLLLGAGLALSLLLASTRLGAQLRELVFATSVTPSPVVVTSTAELGELLSAGTSVRVEDREAPRTAPAGVRRRDYVPEPLSERARARVRHGLDNQVGQSSALYHELQRRERSPANDLAMERQWIQVVASREARRLFDEGKAFALPFDRGLMSDQDWYYYSTPFRTEDRENRMAICAIDLRKCAELREALASLEAKQNAPPTESAVARNQASPSEPKARSDEHADLVNELQSVANRMEHLYVAARDHLESPSRATSQEFHELVARQKLLLEKLARKPASSNEPSLEAERPK